jgi:tRNA(fMet)-specific endonuclease VapC
MDRLAVDTNAVVDYLRPNRPVPPPLLEAETVFLPVVVAGELFAGAWASERSDENVSTIEELVALWPLLQTDAETARIYGRIRADEQPRLRTSSRCAS